MSDDGTGGGIRIPSMLIGVKDGDKLMNWYDQASDEERKQVSIMAQFEMPYNEDDTI